MQEENNLPQIVYYRSRGHAQAIRMLLMAIGVEYQDIFVSKTQGIPPDLREKYNLNLQEFPSLIHEGNLIEQTFPILKYCCLRFGKPQLLGQTVQDQIKVAEICFKYASQKNKSINVLFEEIKKCFGQNNVENLVPKIRQKILKTHLTNKCFQIFGKMYQQRKTFLLGYFTILDLIFYENTFVVFHITDIEVTNAAIEYKNFFETTDFYQQNKQKINSYPFLNLECIPNQIAQIISQVWRQIPRGLQ